MVQASAWWLILIGFLSLGLVTAAFVSCCATVLGHHAEATSSSMSSHDDCPSIRQERKAASEGTHSGLFGDIHEWCGDSPCLHAGMGHAVPVSVNASTAQYPDPPQYAVLPAAASEREGGRLAAPVRPSEACTLETDFSLLFLTTRRLRI